jgi:hypothetical protein
MTKQAMLSRLTRLEGMPGSRLPPCAVVGCNIPADADEIWAESLLTGLRLETHSLVVWVVSSDAPTVLMPPTHPNVMTEAQERVWLDAGSHFPQIQIYRQGADWLVVRFDSEAELDTYLRSARQMLANSVGDIN